MKPVDFDRCNLMALRQAARQATQFYEAYFESVGLRATQFGVLQRLDGVGPISINELAAAMVMDAATMGRAVKPLQRDGYVAIGPGRDGRTRGLKLTKAGPQSSRKAGRRGARPPSRSKKRWAAPMPPPGFAPYCARW